MAAVVYTRAEAALMRDHGYSEGMIIMRREMSEPKALGDVLDDVVGVPSSDVEVTQEAWAIINEHGGDIQLGFHQWAIVQRMIEEGILKGRAGS